MNFLVEEKIKAFVIRDYKYFFFIVISILAIAIRLVFIDFESGDYTYHQSLWYDQLVSNPGLSGFKDNFSNYAPLYLYLVKLCTFLPFSKVVSIKIISIIFDFIIAIYAAKLVSVCRPDNKYLGVISYGAVLFTPTVFVNSSFWGQVDALPMAMVLGAVYYLVIRKEFFAFLMMGIAFSFKLQALFILPIFVIVYFKNRISSIYFLIIPATYVLTVVPAFLGGGQLGSLLGAYLGQVDYYKELTMNAPNIYYIFNGDFDKFNRFGMIAALAVAFMIISMAVLTIKQLSNELLVKLSLLLAIAIPFVLPRMHERYFYFADVISIIAIFICRSPKYLYISMTVILASFLSYLPFLFTKQPFVPFGWLALVMFSAICVLADDIFRNSVRSENIKNELAEQS